MPLVCRRSARRSWYGRGILRLDSSVFHSELQLRLISME